MTHDLSASNTSNASLPPVERRPGAARSPKGHPRTIGRPASPRSPGTPAAARRSADVGRTPPKKGYFK